MIDLIKACNTLCNITQLLDGWHADGTAWSTWDESVRKEAVELQVEIEKELKLVPASEKRIFIIPVDDTHQQSQ
jgi:hypothetical protein